MEKIFFVMPAYNEAANIRSTVEQWYRVVDELNRRGGCEARLVVADDGSRDDTYAIMEEMTASRPAFTPLTKANGGHGQTLLFLYRHALAEGADYVFQTDSDGQTLPAEYWDMHEARHEYDFQIGYRRSRGDGLSRLMVTRVLRLVVRLTMGVWVTDANTPFRLMRADPLRAVTAAMPRDFFLANVAIAALAKRRGYSMRFPTVSFRPRQGGVNSINLRRIISIGIKALSELRAVSRKAGTTARV